MNFWCTLFVTVFGGAIGGIIVILVIDKFIRPKLAPVKIVTIPEKWVGSPLSKGKPSSTDTNLSEAYSEGRHYSFYCLQIRNEKRWFFDAVAEIRKTEMRIIDSAGEDLFSGAKKCRWWTPGEELNKPLFTMDKSNVNEKGQVRVSPDSEECIVIAYNPLDQDLYFRFTIESDGRQSFPHYEDKINALPCYAIVEIRGNTSKDVYLKIDKGKYFKGLGIEIITKDNVPSLPKAA